MKKKAVRVDASQRYRRFVLERDRALERILLNFQLQASDISGHAFRQMLLIAASSVARQRKSQDWDVGLQHDLTMIAHMAALQVAPVIERTKRLAYSLAGAGQAEALGIAGQPKSKFRHTTSFTDSIRDSLAGGPIKQRIKMYFMRVAHDVVDAARMSDLTGEERAAAEKRILRALPEAKPAPKRAPVVLREAAKKPGFDREDMSVNFVSDQEWDEIADAYVKKYVPSGRGPNDIVNPGSKAEDVIYNWEVEKDLTEEFVYAVRAGDHDAARQSGVDDLLWVAVLDARTDYCCEWRDGLTTTEIESELSGSHKDDECRTSVPPAHFNCRCRLVPASSSISDELPNNAKEFDEWLAT